MNRSESYPLEIMMFVRSFFIATALINILINTKLLNYNVLISYCLLD